MVQAALFRAPTTGQNGATKGKFRRQFNRLSAIMPSHVSSVGAEQDLGRAVEDLKRELSEAHRREAATAAVLKSSAAHPATCGRFSKAIVQTARKLCSAERAIVWRLEDATFRPMAFDGMDVERIGVVAQYRMPLGQESVMGRAVLAGRAVHVPDILADPSLGAMQHALSSSGSIRTVLAAPLVKKVSRSGSSPSHAQSYRRSPSVRSN
jgi:hypothetical protein